MTYKNRDYKNRVRNYELRQERDLTTPALLATLFIGYVFLIVTWLNDIDTHAMLADPATIPQISLIGCLPEHDDINQLKTTAQIDL